MGNVLYSLWLISDVSVTWNSKRLYMLSTGGIKLTFSSATVTKELAYGPLVVTDELVLYRQRLRSCTPGGPLEPFGPGAPVSPLGPCDPLNPWGPRSPRGPSTPGGPGGPTMPGCPVVPRGPGLPGKPLGPWGPGGPCNPREPDGPAGPCGPWSVVPRLAGMIPVLFTCERKHQV